MKKPAATRAQRIKRASATRREQQKEQLQQAILTAASELFLEHGYENFSLRQVAERIGYSPTTIYLYFADKDELLFAVALEGFERFGEMLQRAYENESEPLLRLESIGRAYIDFGLRHPAHYQLMFMQRPEFLLRPHPEKKKPAIDSFGVLARAVQEGMATGAIKAADPLAQAHVLWAGVHGVVSLALSMPALAAVDMERRLDLYFAMVKAGLGKEAVMS